MRAIRLRSRSEDFDAEVPWAGVVRSGATRVWLLRGTPDEDGVDARGIGAALRLVFQSRFDDAPERLAVYREFDVPDVS